MAIFWWLCHLLYEDFSAVLITLNSLARSDAMAYDLATENEELEIHSYSAHPAQHSSSAGSYVNGVSKGKC